MRFQIRLRSSRVSVARAALVGLLLWASQAAAQRFEPLQAQLLNADQQSYLQRVTAAGENAGSGPFRLLARVPEIGSLLLDIHLQLRDHGDLSDRERELAALMTARAWSAQSAWSAHVPSARRAGLTAKDVDALARRRKPGHLSTEESAAWQVADELLFHRQIGDATFNAALAALGAERLVNLTMLVTNIELLDMLEVLDSPAKRATASGALAPLQFSVGPLAPGALGPVPGFEPLGAGEGPATGEFQITGGRFPPLKWSEMNADQKLLADQLLGSWRHSVSSVFIPLERSPQLAAVYERLGSALNPRTTLMDPLLRNFATLIVTREWRAQFEYWAAHRNAVRSGLAEEQVAAVRDGRQPPAMEPRLAAAYALCRELLDQRRVSQATFDAARSLLGDRDTIGTVVMLGFYGMVAAQTEALDRYPLPAGIAAELPD